MFEVDLLLFHLHQENKVRYIDKGAVRTAGILMLSFSRASSCNSATSFRSSTQHFYRRRHLDYTAIVTQNTAIHFAKEIIGSFSWQFSGI